MRISTQKFYEKPNGEKVRLGSGWEVLLATLLDKSGYEWTQPKPLPWTDSNGKPHKYYPDFYLPEYGIYFEVKSTLSYKLAKEKVDFIIKHYKNVIMLWNVKEIKNFNAHLKLPATRRLVWVTEN